MKLALALIVKGTDDEALVLDDCLENIAKYVDKVFVTLTQENEKVREIAKKHSAEISFYEWDNDFASARNFNFSQVPKEYDYILWCDADDNFRGLEHLKSLLEQYKYIDVFSMNYLYHFNEYRQADVVHMKTQIVKNDGCVSWAGRLHEDFKENRTLTRYFIKDIERIHQASDERMEQSKARNLVVALSDAGQNPDDPRVYWNVANSQIALGKNQDAKISFEKFVSLSHSEEEKYLAYINLGRVCFELGEKDKAVEYSRMAIGLRPEYPDAYHSLGQIFYNMGKYREAEKHIVLGLTKKPPYYSIIVYNPREYDFAPLSLLAKVYFQLSRPDQALTCLKACLKIQPKNEDIKGKVSLLEKENEKFTKVLKVIEKARKARTKEEIKKLLDGVPAELASHPGICNLRNIHFPKTESSGKDLVYYCGFTQEEWTPDTAKRKGIGGSEEAVIWLTSLFAKDGWNVTVYNNCGHQAMTFDGVTYRPFWEWNYRDKQDVVIVWRNPQVLDYEINAPTVLYDMHDVIPDGEITKGRMSRATKIMVKSKYQRELYPHIEDEKFEIIPNGIDEKLFEQELKRENDLIINTSAPNRGIYALTHMFREIKKQHPKARLVWAYGWETFNNGFREDSKVMKWAEELRKDMEEIGVESIGRISHSEVAVMYLKAGIWAYPSGFGEIDCISLSKAMAGGAYPVATDFAALGEKKGHGGDFIHSDVTSNNWLKPNQYDFSIIDKEQIQKSIDAIVFRLKNPPTEEERESMRKWARETYDWNRIYKLWENICHTTKF